jgi:hypothetical protein
MYMYMYSQYNVMTLCPVARKPETHVQASFLNKFLPILDKEASFLILTRPKRACRAFFAICGFSLGASAPEVLNTRTPTSEGIRAQRRKCRPEVYKHARPSVKGFLIKAPPPDPEASFLSVR